MPVAVAAYAAAAVLLVQPVGCNQTAHYAAVRSLAHGRADIDRYHWQTCDKSYADGHFYAAKAPGMDFLATPYWLVLHRLGLAEDPVPSQSSPNALYEVPPLGVWLVTLWAVVLPATALVLLVLWAGERVAPGYGTASALTLGVGTLMFPFATLLFSHVLSAFLGFAAFCVLFRERHHRSSIGLVFGAGVLAGLASLTEYPLALVAAALAVYATVGEDWLRRGSAYAAGGMLGLLPLALYNVWAFGAVGTLSYANVVIDQGQSGHDKTGLQAEGFFGVTAPSLRVGLELLLSAKGLLILAPVLAVGAGGVVALYRRGLRAEALVTGVLAAAFLVYNSGYWLPFGGDTPGPRFLLPLLPFLTYPLALAYQRFPATTLATAAVSMLIAVAATITEPLLGTHDPSRWFERVGEGDFTSTLLGEAGAGSGWLAVSPVLAALSLACLAALAATPRAKPARRDLKLLAITLGGWVVLATVGPAYLDPADPAGIRVQLGVLTLAAGVVAAGARAALAQRTSTPPPRAEAT